MSPRPLIDPLAIKTLRSLAIDENDDFLREIFGLFFSDTPVRIADLTQSLASGDRLKFERAAHCIKGSASNLGARILEDVAEQVENRARDKGLDGMAPEIERIKVEYARAQHELEQILLAPH